VWTLAVAPTYDCTPVRDDRRTASPQEGASKARPAQIEPVEIEQVERVVEQPVLAVRGEIGVEQPEIRDARESGTTPSRREPRPHPDAPASRASLPGSCIRHFDYAHALAAARCAPVMSSTSKPSPAFRSVKRRSP
jgi:hypothetical protein